MKVLRVALDIPLTTLFDYALPDGLWAHAGDRVAVPFGARERVGVVLEVEAESQIEPERVKPITRVLDDAPRLPADWLELVRFLAGYYQRPLGETVLSSLPPRLRSLRPLPREAERFYRAGVNAPSPDTLKAARKRALLETLGEGCLAEGALLAPFAGQVEATRSALRSMLRAGWIEAARAPSGARFVAQHAASREQAAAIERVARAPGSFQPFLLHGVTGSGKTEVYLHLIARVLERGAQALVMVPEISLTPQLEARFRYAFPDTRLAVLHSALDDGTRTSAWLAAARGEAGIVLGTRLAVLTPLPRLALVVVDEEHDSSFKQQEGLRYSGRDAAVYRAKLAGCPAVLGTATPALETWYNCQAGRYTLLELPQRAAPGSVLPAVRLVDLGRESAEHGLAPSLVAAIEARLARGEQSLVFINRRGYAPVLGCEACGWAAGCTRCSAHMVLHAADRRLRCHHCGAESAIPRACPTCGNVDLKAIGRGTQRIEETLAARFAHARIVRIDRDSVRRRGELTRTLEGIRRGEADILVGTQLLAKGHDFPALTLVGVLNADSALFSTDYRAAERLYATLAQVAGRAGRRERPGEVLVQTRFPGHPLYAALARHDYAGFAASQLAERKAAGFPPYVFEAALRAEAKQLARTLEFLRAAAALVAPPAEVRVYDPVPAVVTRRADFERAQLVVQSPSRAALQEFLRAWSERLFAQAPRDVRWHLDVDPIEFD